MYNSFMILLMGTISFLIPGLPAGYWLNARLSGHPAAEVTYAYALFAGYVLYAVPSMYLARAGVPVRMFAWALPPGSGSRPCMVPDSDEEDREAPGAHSAPMVRPERAGGIRCCELRGPYNGYAPLQA